MSAGSSPVRPLLPGASAVGCLLSLSQAVESWEALHLECPGTPSVLPGGLVRALNSAHPDSSRTVGGTGTWASEEKPTVELHRKKG